jgi:hypothetical protein
MALTPPKISAYGSLKIEGKNYHEKPLFKLCGEIFARQIIRGRPLDNWNKNTLIFRSK